MYSVLRRLCAPQRWLALHHSFLAKVSWCACSTGAVSVSPFRRDQRLSGLGLARAATTFASTTSPFVSEKGEVDFTSVCWPPFFLVSHRPVPWLDENTGTGVQEKGSCEKQQHSPNIFVIALDRCPSPPWPRAWSGENQVSSVPAL